MGRNFIAFHVLLAVFAVVSLAYAQGTLSVPYTADHQTALTWARNRAESGLSVTNYAIAQCQALFDGYVADRARDLELQASIRDKYIGLPDADKTAVEAYIDACITNGSCS